MQLSAQTLHIKNFVASRGDSLLILRSTGLDMTDPRQRAWIEVQSSAIESNTRILRGFVAENCLLMAVVKADGYGHGAVTVAQAALKGGAEFLGVATLQEGLDLRQSGITCPILLLGNLTQNGDIEASLHWDLIPTISSLREALLCQQIAEDLGVNFIVHLKVDTGMSRLGCEFNEAFELIKKIDELKNVVLAGIYSHLALADDLVSEVTNQQQEKFEKLLRMLGPRENALCCHLANSAGTLRTRRLHYNMVRVGLALYGYSPISKFHKNLGLKPALSVKARVTLVRQVPKGIGVSYGHKFITKRPTRLAVVGIGYADGVSRTLSGKLCALNKGRFIKQIGAITMDQLVLDVTDFLDVEVGSVVTLLGPDQENCITPQQWSNWSGSIPWEVLCGFKHRLPRIVI